ncbi:Uma2 family endonuclease [Methylomonas sp. UP202]|uniref:Uma2 family endonuclease n=1 Tax=Methylomonas sp. UP202 TaxID=3040943 RepID=UPI00247872E7|nr:Uma2 family endonuclease [Methylomonas sp. UP202]WGS83955.1 Uma2 family endonuclease [Methylomonas sp. UP202]
MTTHSSHSTETVMALQHDKSFMTEAQYLASERLSDSKHEYLDGQVVAMAGANHNHSRISANVLGEFRNHLKGGDCETFMADTKVKAGQNYFYPDVVVDCTNPAGDADFLTSPTLIVEVLSASTRKIDTTKKLLHYINIPTLEEYVLIEQDIVSIIVMRRKSDWRSEYYYLGDQVTFDAIQLTLSVEAIYERVDNDDLKQFKAK